MSKVLGNLKTGLLFIVSAPAGTGKTTLVQMVMEEFPCVTESVSFTTRKPRSGEEEGVHYHFIDKAQFQKKIEDGDFLEFARVYNDYYGTSRTWVNERLQRGEHVVLVIDTQGAMQLKEKIPATSIFIAPPSMEELERRLIERKTEDEDSIVERLEWAKNEIKAKIHYDYIIINDNLDVAYQVLRSIIIAEEHKNFERLKLREKNGKQ